MTQSRQELLAELERARKRVEELERKLEHDESVSEERDELSRDEFLRFGRQMILPSVGLPGQMKLKKARLLVIGAGGLGCPSMLYLAAAGVGHMTVLDSDCVELSNLHRQVLHSTAKIGRPKVDSAASSLRAISPRARIETRQVLFDTSYVSSLPANDSVRQGLFDVVLDCSDNPSTRHFVNAYAVKHGITLVSGGAVRTDGVVGIYNLATLANERGPCYACLHPPPDPNNEAPTNEIDKALLGTGACSDEGVLGVTCGMVGITMATEVLRVLLGQAAPTMHLITFSSSPFRTIKLRSRKPSCTVCARSDDIDLSHFAYPEACVVPLLQDVNVNRVEYEQAKGSLIIDTRPEVEFGICHLDGSCNWPFAKLIRDPESVLKEAAVGGAEVVTLTCRRGNDSLLAAKVLQSTAERQGIKIRIQELRGGWEAYAREHDDVIY